jgi:hypothetical protein
MVLVMEFLYVAILIVTLDSPSFQKREAATLALNRHIDCWDSIYNTAKKHDSLEVKQRCHIVLTYLWPHLSVIKQHQVIVSLLPDGLVRLPYSTEFPQWTRIRDESNISEQYRVTLKPITIMDFQSIESTLNYMVTTELAWWQGNRCWLCSRRFRELP